MQPLRLKAALILDNTTGLKFSSRVSNLSQWSQIPFFNLESQHFYKISKFQKHLQSGQCWPHLNCHAPSLIPTLTSPK